MKWFKKQGKEKPETISGNTFRSPQIVADEPAKKTRRKPSSKKNIPLLGWLQSILDGSILSRDSFTRTLPFGLFLGLLGLLYIANSYYAIRQIRKIDRLMNEMNEYQYEYITTKSSLMYNSKPSELSNRLENSGIKESVKPPEKIFIEE